MADKSKKGYILAHRSLRDTWLWKDKPFNHASVWMDFLFEANHSENKVAYKDSIIKIKRGEFPFSLRKYAKKYGWTIWKLRKFLTLLEKDSKIRTHTKHYLTVISICNYETYQDYKNVLFTKSARTPNAPQTHTKRTPNNHNTLNTLNTLNEDKGVVTFENNKPTDLNGSIDLKPVPELEIWKKVYRYFGLQEYAYQQYMNTIRKCIQRHGFDKVLECSGLMIRDNKRSADCSTLDKFMRWGIDEYVAKGVKKVSGDDKIIREQMERRKVKNNLKEDSGEQIEWLKKELGRIGN